MGSRDDERYGRLVDNPGFLAARFSYLAAGASARALTPYGLRIRTYSLLELAAASSDGLSQREIGRILCIDKAHVVRLVDEVAGMDLVLRVRDPRDRRSWLICATPEGAARADEAGRALAEEHARMLAPLTKADRTSAMAALRVLAFELGLDDGRSSAGD